MRTIFTLKGPALKSFIDGGNLKSGAKIGIFEPSQVAMRMPDGKEFANAKSDRKALIFLQGEEDTFTTTWYNNGIESSGDMQKSDMVIMEKCF